MKKTSHFSTFILSVAVAFTLTSCDLISGPNLADQASVDKKLRSKIEKHIDPQATIFEIDMGTTSDFSTEMDVAVITYIEPSSTEVKRGNFDIQGKQPPRDTSNFVDRKYKNLTVEDGIKLCDVDFSQIASNVSKGVEIIEPEGVKLDGIGMYRMKFNKDASKIVHEFSILSRAGTEMGTQHGRAALITNYYEFDFTADAEGNVTIKE